MKAVISTSLSLLEKLTPPSTNHQQQNMSVDPSFKAFHPSRVTTTVIPLNIRQTVKTIKNRHDQRLLKHKSNSTVTTHRIGDWTIRESLEPFPQNENKSSSIKPNVLQWTIDDVCLFFEHVLGTNYFTPIIQEHLIDGIALLLLKEEHLTNIFQMQSRFRIKLLNRIDKLKTDDLSVL